MGNQLPYIQFYIKDFISATAHMSCTERGAYITLLCTAWVSDPAATLPDDDEKLRRIAGADKDEWETIRANVREKFEKDDRFPGRVVNNRLRIEFENYQDHKEMQSERGKKGAARRWGKEKSSIDPSITKGVREADDE